MGSRMDKGLDFCRLAFSLQTLPYLVIPALLAGEVTNSNREYVDVV